MLKSYTGSCHCGAVRFVASLDLRAGTGRCNCSICTKTRAWNARIKPEDFQLVAGAEALTDYQFATHSAHHVFCKHCGVRPFGHGYVEQIGGAYYALNVACLDNVDADELANAPIHYSDGLHNNWQNRPADIRNL